MSNRRFDSVNFAFNYAKVRPYELSRLLAIGLNSRSRVLAANFLMSRADKRRARAAEI